MKVFRICWCFVMFSGFCGAQSPWPVLEKWESGKPLEGSKMLTLEGDLSLKLVKMNDSFLDRQIERAVEERPGLWKDGDSIARNRAKLGEMLGLHRDQRTEFPEPAFWDLSETDQWKIRRVKWRAFDEVYGYGLLLEPKGQIRADVIFVPDSEGMTSLPPDAAELARSGCRVLIPRLIPRTLHPLYPMSNREWLHRPAFELGRTLIGYELHKIFSAADWFSENRPLGIAGQGEGGLVSLYAGALDERFGSVGVSGYFGPHDLLWEEPVDRNVFGLVSGFGNAEIARLVHPRKLVVTHSGGTPYHYRASELLLTRPKLPGKPGSTRAFQFNEMRKEWDRIPPAYREGGVCAESDKTWIEEFSENLGVPMEFVTQGPVPVANWETREIEEIEKHNQWVLLEASADRKTYWKDLDTRSLDSFQKSVAPFRDKFRRDGIGDFELPRLPFNARTRSYEEGTKTISYEVVLDVMEGVIAYGILTLPKDLKTGEKRPVVVCQHGLEGTPQDVIGEEKYSAYKAFATRLAEEGFITFAPQNGYRYFDLFRMQQFKAQSIGKTLFSIIVPQHQQITDWLATLPVVDSEKIAFYGLSYGGKAAMRIPPLVDRYCLSICSGDFNDWVWKNAATDPESLRYSYANKGEYEMFEWNLGGTFNYAEMATLIAPRPFMVERGHFDGVAPDDRVAFEFARVRNLYQAQLGIGDRCEIEWFVGPHTINGVGTFRFLRSHLGMPAR